MLAVRRQIKFAFNRRSFVLLLDLGALKAISIRPYNTGILRGHISFKKSMFSCFNQKG